MRHHQGVKRRATQQRAVRATIAGLVGLVLTGCGPTTSPPDSADPIPQTLFNSAIAAQVPGTIASAGEVTIATDPTYEPMEFQETGRIRGADIDLARAIAATLGLRVELSQQAFSTIVASVAADRYQLGMSSLWAVEANSGLTDMITYFQSGIRAAIRKGEKAPSDLAAGLCGYRVSIEEGTEFIDDLVKQNAKCEENSQKPVTILAKTDQAGATEALLAGKADAMVADSPVVDYSVNTHPDTLKKLKSAGVDRDYGIAASPNIPGWGKVIQQAVQALIDGGQYQEILARWKLRAGAIKTAELIPAHPANEPQR